MIHDRPGVLQNFMRVPLREAVATGMMRIDAREHARPRRPADGDVAVRLCEPHAAFGKSSHARRSRLRMPAKAFDIVIQVVTNDQDDIRSLGRANRTGVRHVRDADTDTDKANGCFQVHDGAHR